MNPALDNGQNGGNNFFNMIGNFQQFKQNFQGDPKQKVEELLSSGKMSQEQFNRFSQMANQLRGILH